MLKRIVIIAAAAILALASGYANENKSKITIPVNRIDPTDGKQMYSSYCAPCHGTNGQGNGPAASALKPPPSDLTGLARSNGGKYPGNHVVSVLEFGSALPAHGSAQMPVWGPMFGKIANVNSHEETLRINNLSRYLESIQAK